MLAVAWYTVAIGSFALNHYIDAEVARTGSHGRSNDRIEVSLSLGDPPGAGPFTTGRRPNRPN